MRWWPFRERQPAGNPPSKPSAQQGVIRKWENLPSLALTPVYEPFSFRELTAYILKTAPTKDLIEIVSYGWETTPEEAFHDTELPWEFADNPKLAFIFRRSENPNKQAVIIRTAFMREAADVIEATTWRTLIDSLSRWAAQHGYSSRFV